MRGRQRWMCRFCWVSAFVGFHLLSILQCSYAHRKVPQRKSRQTAEADETVDGIPGAWSSWGPWSACSSSCGIGIMEQGRRCILQEPRGQRWAHQPRGLYSQPRTPYGEDGRTPYPGGAISALKPAYPLHVDREPLTYPHGQSVPLQAQQELGGRRGGNGPNQHSVPLYDNGYSSNQPDVPVYRPEHPTNGVSAPRQGYGHLSNQGLLPLYRRGQPSNHDRQRLPANRDSPSLYGAQSLTNRESSPLYAHEGSSNRGSGSQPRQRSAADWRVSTGNRRSLLMREELHSSNRSRVRDTIRPGQYGYGKVPSTFQLHGGMAHLQQETGRDRQGRQSSSRLPRLSEGAAAQTAPQGEPGARREPESGRQARRGARAAQEENQAWQGFEIQAQAARRLSGSQASGLQASGSIEGRVGVQKGLRAPPEWGQHPGESAAEDASGKTQHRGAPGAGTEQQRLSVDGVLDGPNHTSFARQPNPARRVEVVASSQPAGQVPEEPAGEVPSRGGPQALATHQRPHGHERALQGHMFGYLAPDNGESGARGLLEIPDEYSYREPAQRQAKHESDPQTRLRHRSPRLGPQSEPQRTQQKETTSRKIERRVPPGQGAPADSPQGGTVIRARLLPPAYGASTKPGRQSQPEAPHRASSRGSRSAPESPRHTAPQKVHREEFQSPHKSFRRAQHTHLEGGVQAPETQASTGRRPRRQDYGVGTYPRADIHDQDWNPHQWPTAACPGVERQYRTCTSLACPSSASDPRKAQCAGFNHLQFMGRYYEWEPFTEVRKDQRCELNCRPTGYRFYVRQADSVSDGTPCEANSTDVCVGGSCLTPGCDGMLGSGARPDKCGECGGDGSSCELVFGTFEDSQVNVGYHKIVEIPTGATKINVTEMARSRNYLALRSRSGRSIINGNWAIDRPGKYEAAGTMFVYKRPTELRGESFVAEGPTTESLDVFMIFQQENPGIRYEFVLPVEKPADPRQNSHHPGQGYGARPAGEPMDVSVLGNGPGPGPVHQRSHVVPRARGGQRDRRLQVYHTETQEEPAQTQPVYRWKSQSATECSASCGKGFQSPIFRCVAQNTQEVVPDSQCDSALKPASPGRACNTQPCPAFWSLGAWSECSKACGPGIHHRQVLCRQAYANRTVTVHQHRCGHLEKPNATQPCQTQLCTRWQIQTDWESCSVPCGVGQRKRGIRCVSNQGDVVGEGQCNGKHKPTDSETCDMGPCVKTWFYTDWSNKCSVECGVGVQKRSVLCLTNHINDRSAESCEGAKPPETRACARGRCERQVRWYASPWNQCPIQCGNGTQNRDLICVIKLGTDFTVTAPSDCAHLDKPSSVQPCSAGPCGARWFNTAWSECSKSCLGGVQVREVRCLDDGGFPSSLCDVMGKLADQRMCNTHPCSPELDENCKDKHYNCPVVVQARLCVYSYYKMVCCASCTHAARRSSDLRRHDASARRGAA